MQIDLKNLVPITEANQNFSKVARMVDNKGTAVILKNHKLNDVLLAYNILVQEEQEATVVAAQASVDDVANAILSRHLDAFNELAK